MSKKKDDPKTMAQMRLWLEDASKVLDVDPQVVLSVVEPLLLDLASDTSKYTSRPGTPPTGFVVGLAVGLAGGDTDTQVANAKSAVKKLRQHIADNYKGEE